MAVVSLTLALFTSLCARAPQLAEIYQSEVLKVIFESSKSPLLENNAPIGFWVSLIGSFQCIIEPPGQRILRIRQH